jgi:hypothetical protein
VIFRDGARQPGVLLDLAEVAGPDRAHARRGDDEDRVDLARIGQEAGRVDDLLRLAGTWFIEQREHTTDDAALGRVIPLHELPNPDLLMLEGRQQAPRPVDVDRRADVATRSCRTPATQGHEPRVDRRDEARVGVHRPAWVLFLGVVDGTDLAAEAAAERDLVEVRVHDEADERASLPGGGVGDHAAFCHPSVAMRSSAVRTSRPSNSRPV